jgi:hypothetical protein
MFLWETQRYFVSMLSGLRNRMKTNLTGIKMFLVLGSVRRLIMKLTIGLMTILKQAKILKYGTNINTNTQSLNVNLAMEYIKMDIVIPTMY